MGCICSICGKQSSITADLAKWTPELQAASELLPVTRKGQFPGDVKGFICLSCFGYATQMRARFQRAAHLKSPEDNIIVTDHAAIRFISRQPVPFTTRKDPKDILLKLFRDARKIRFKKGFMVERIINNNFTDVDYYFHSGWIFVCTKRAPRTILTAERQGPRKLNQDFWFVDETTQVAGAASPGTGRMAFRDGEAHVSGSEPSGGHV